MSTNKAIIIKSIAQLKQEPKHHSELADEVLFGMTVDVLKEADEWLHVETSYGYKGYLNKCDVYLGNNSLWDSGEKFFVKAPFADIQKNAKYSSNATISIPRGSYVVMAGEKQDNWLEVLLPQGEKGWIREEALLAQQSKAGTELRQSIVDTALLYLGIQYRWGGKTPMGIDCSGLSSMAYLLNGIVLPRDSEDQMNFMRRISRKESKPGDLLFFPGHVAIYIGEDKFVHSTGMDAIVKINSLNKDSKFYRKDLDEKYICTGTVF